MFKVGDKVIQLKRLERGAGVVVACPDDAILVRFDGQPSPVRLCPCGERADSPRDRRRGLLLPAQLRPGSASVSRRAAAPPSR